MNQEVTDDLIEKIGAVYNKFEASHGVYDSDLHGLRWELPMYRDLIVLAEQIAAPEVKS